MSTENEIRERLGACLDKLKKIRPTDLIREEELGQLNFRAGIPFFGRTLTLYRRIADTNLSRVPSAMLEIAANHAEESLNQFQQIEAFTPAGIDRPEQIRNLLINDVREAHAGIYEDLCILLAPSGAQMEKVSRAPSQTWIVVALAFVVIAGYLGYHSSLGEDLIHNLQDRVRAFLPH